MNVITLVNPYSLLNLYLPQVSQLHSSLVKWMVQLLLALSGTQVHQVKGEEEGKGGERRAVLLTELQTDCAALSDALNKFTKLLSRYSGALQHYSIVVLYSTTGIVVL